MLTLDGSFGEGGGQIVRSALTLSLASGQAFRLKNIRAGRSRPGLLQQHLTAVEAAVQVGRGRAKGATLGSRDLEFHPGQIHGGDYRFSVPTAGSATLVLQAILPILVTAQPASRVRLEGGTHNPSAPSYDFLERTFVPLLNRLGPRVSVRLQRRGFYPAGGGRFEVEIEPAARLAHFELPARGRLGQLSASAVVARLPRHIAIRQREVLVQRIGLDPDRIAIIEEPRARGPGNVLVVHVESEFVTETITEFGRKGVPAERVAADAADQTRRYLDAGVPVGPHLADQLLLPLSLGSGGGYCTVEPTAHTRTNISIIRQFLGNSVEVAAATDDACMIQVAATA